MGEQIFDMVVGDASFVEPASSPALERANEAERRLLEDEVGMWRPFTFTKPGAAAALKTTMEQRGFKCRRIRLTIYVQAGANSRPHSHVWRYPPGVQDITQCAGVCACGTTKPPVDVDKAGRVVEGAVNGAGTQD